MQADRRDVESVSAAQTPISGRHVGRVNDEAAILVINRFDDEIEPAVDVDGNVLNSIESAVKRHLTARKCVFGDDYLYPQSCG